MPNAPPRTCEICRTAHTGRCPRKEQPRNRESANERGYDYRWQQARISYLAENPLCSECQWYGRVTPALAVDHRKPHRGNQEWFWNRDNWQPLCSRCHNGKTNRENKAMPKYVVCGGQGAGKSTWVKQRAKPGDLVFDADDLLLTMFQLPMHSSMSNAAAIIERLRQAVVDFLLSYPDRSAYIIQGNESKARETAGWLGATLVRLDKFVASRDDIGSNDAAPVEG